MKNFVENHVLYVKVDYAAAYFIEFVVKQLVYYRDEAMMVFKKILYQKLWLFNFFWSSFAKPKLTPLIFLSTPARPEKDMFWTSKN